MKNQNSVQQEQEQELRTQWLKEEEIALLKLIEGTKQIKN